MTSEIDIQIDGKTLAKSLMPYLDPSDIHYVDVGIPGYRVLTQNAVLRLKAQHEQIPIEYCNPVHADTQEFAQRILAIVSDARAVIHDTDILIRVLEVIEDFCKEQL